MRWTVNSSWKIDVSNWISIYSALAALLSRKYLLWYASKWWCAYSGGSLIVARQNMTNVLSLYSPYFSALLAISFQFGNLSQGGCGRLALTMHWNTKYGFCITWLCTKFLPRFLFQFTTVVSFESPWPADILTALQFSNFYLTSEEAEEDAKPVYFYNVWKGQYEIVSLLWATRSYLELLCCGSKVKDVKCYVMLTGCNYYLQNMLIYASPNQHDFKINHDLLAKSILKFRNYILMKYMFVSPPQLSTTKVCSHQSHFYTQWKKECERFESKSNQ